jgi:tight adherence protein B
MSELLQGLPLLLAQAVEAEAPPDDGGLLLALIYLLAFIGVFVFVVVGYLMFSSGWESYEEKYIEGAERTVEDLFLTIPPQQLLWLSVLGAFAGFTAGFVTSNSLIIGAVLGGPGFLSPRLFLTLMKKRRLGLFNEQLVEAMVTVTNALRAGVSMPKAFQLVSQDMPKPICQEFGILVQELRLGMELDEALGNMLTRMPSQDLDLVVTSITISNTVGGNLAEVFDRIAETIRERRRIEGRIEALTAQGKMQGLLVSILPIFVGVMIYWIDPKLMEPMFNTPIGWAVFALMFVMEGMGYFFIQKVTTIEV